MPKIRINSLNRSLGGPVCAVLAVFVLISAAYTSASGAGGDAKSGFLRLQDVFAMQFASDPQISPDGSTIVYVRNSFDIMTDRRRSELWMISKKDGHQPLFTALRFPNPRSPRWSPDGSRIIFLARDEHGKTQIFSYWLKSRNIGRLTAVNQSPNGLSWSPDGKNIGFFMRVPESPKPFAKLPGKPKGAKWAPPPKTVTRLRYRADGVGFLPFGYSHLFVVSADGGTARRITSGKYNHGGRIAWTSNSGSIIFSGNRHGNWEYEPRDTELYIANLSNGTIRPMTSRFGPDGSPALSSDGKTVAYVGYDDKLLGYHNRNIYLIGTEGGDPKEITGGFDRSAGPPVWNPVAKRWVFTFSDHGNTKLASIGIAGDVKVLASDLGSNSNGRPYGGGGAVSVARNGAVAFTITTPEHPGDVAVLEPGGEVTRLTKLNSAWLASKKLGKVTEIRYKSGYDGREIQGWYITPPDFDPKKKYPLILEIHGGPFADYGNRFTAELQLYAAAGYVVLYTNPRGSTSYGAEFANLIHHNYPSNDYDDLMSGVDAILAKGFIDKDALFVTGGSGGGVLSAWIVGKTDRFRAAVVAKPVINWYSFVLTSDGTPVFYKYWFTGFPWDRQEEYMKRSPISLVGNVKTPTMLLTGERDNRTPISETEQFYTALKLRKIDTAMVRIPAASHGIASRPSQLMAKVAYILKWFEKHSAARAE